MPGTGLTPGMGRAGEAPLDWESLEEQMGSWWYGFSFLFQTLRVCSLTAQKRRQGCSFIVEEQSYKYFRLLFLGVLVFISHGWYAVLRGVTSKFCGLFKATKAPHRFGSSMYRSWRHIGDGAVCYNLPCVTEKHAHFVLLISVHFCYLFSLLCPKLVLWGEIYKAV